MATTPIPSYVRPPLTEVACGVQFSPLPLQTRHIGQFWTELREEYPLTQDAPPIPEVTDSPGINIMTLPPLRRVFIATKTTDYVMQVQEARFHHNWRLTPGLQYPRFETVFSRFIQAWGRFSEFVKRQTMPEPKPNRYELTYINELEALGTIPVERAVKLFDWRQLNTKFLPEPRTSNVSWAFPLPDGKGEMNVSTNRLTRPDGRTAVVLTLACSGPAEKFSLDEWFGTAHEWIVRGFTDLTTEEAHQIWEREA